jgi:type VI secretion system protein ImpH
MAGASDADAHPNPAPTPANDASATAEAVDALLSALREAPYRFDFYQAMRRLESIYRERPRWGTALRPADEPLRLGQEVTLAAAPSTLARFVPAQGATPARLYSYFFGMLGPTGPLPLHITEYAKQRAHLNHDRSLVAFLDLFHHRMLALYYRARSSADPVAQRDRPEDDRFAMYVGSMLGVGLPGLRDRDAMPDNAKLYYGGLLAAQTRNAEGLRSILEDYLQVRAHIEQFVGEWVNLPASQAWKLGQPPSRNSPQLGRLASTALVGSRVWLRQHRFRISLGPLRHDQFRALLPGTQGFLHITAIVRNYIGDELKWDLRLKLAPDAIRPAQLGAGAQLGRTSWLVARTDNTDWEDLIVDPSQDYDRKVGKTRNKPLSSPPRRKA